MRFLLVLLLLFCTSALGIEETSLDTFQSRVIPHSEAIQVVLLYSSDEPEPSGFLDLMKYAEKSCAKNKIEFRKIDILVESQMQHYKHMLPRVMVSYKNNVLMDMPNQPLVPGIEKAFSNALKLADKEIEKIRKKPL